mgnify:CR=1 FL=1
MSKVVGIDLGTTNSLVAVVEGGRPVVITDAQGDGLVPSVVSLANDGTLLVGREAQQRLLTDAERTIYSAKRFMGKGIDDVAQEAALLPFRVSGESGGVVRVGIGGREFTPPEVGAIVLRALKQRAETYFAAQGDIDPTVDRAVITVPAYFNDAQRTATRDAGRLAGLDVLRIINEPTAASLAYGLNARQAGLIAVYDFGGGTFDISILRVEDGVFQVLATNGDTHLGGDDIDRVLVEWVLADLESATPRFSMAALGLPTGTPFVRTAQRVEQIRDAVVRAKCELSEATSTSLLGLPLTRDEFETRVRAVIDRTLVPCRAALADAGVNASQVDDVVLVGGSTRIPLVRRLVGELFGRTPHTDLNPDEVVALGAAVQADILVTGNRDMLLLDVTPLSLGIETMGGVVSKLILRNSTIPATGSEMFTTGVDNQTAVDIHVLQGERELVADNRSLARFRLRGIPPMPAGLPRVQVQFQIDANGILSVTATELRTNVEQTIEVTPSYGLTDEQVEQMLIDSFEHAEADVDARLLIEAQNEARSVITATEKTLADEVFVTAVAQELAPGEQTRIVEALAALVAVVSGRDRAAIEQATGVLNAATRNVAELMMNRSVAAALAGRNVDQI